VFFAILNFLHDAQEITSPDQPDIFFSITFFQQTPGEIDQFRGVVTSDIIFNG
jgi:hypothetical protein